MMLSRRLGQTSMEVGYPRDCRSEGEVWKCRWLVRYQSWTNRVCFEQEIKIGCYNLWNSALVARDPLDQSMLIPRAFGALNRESLRYQRVHLIFSVLLMKKIEYLI